VSDAAAFIAAIIAEPDDDVPRLVFADWLDEHGQPERSEFIRVQVELAACWLCRGQPETQWRRCGSCRALRRRERKVGYQGQPNVSQWFAQSLSVGWPDPGAMLYGSLRPGYTRGFVSSVTLSWADWQAHAKQLLEAAPLRRVNRPRSCERCGGRRYVEVGFSPFHNPCPACRGAGTVDDWRGDGRVVLTDWPVMSIVVAPDRQWHVLGVPDEIPDGCTTEVMSPGLFPDSCRRLLAAEWPGVRFELPAAQRWYDADEVAAMISGTEDAEALTGGRP
jgi:uncharacterized protein (TIGR02996 family)